MVTKLHNRVKFGLQKVERVSKTKEAFKILSIEKLHLYEFSKLLAKILKDWVEYFPNDSTVTETEIENFFEEEEEDLFIHLIRINNTLAKSTIFTDGRDKQRVTVNFFSVCSGDRSRIQEVNFTQRI